MADRLAFCPRCGAGHVPAAPDADPWAKVYGSFSGDAQLFGAPLETTTVELADDDPRALDAFGVPMRRGDLAMHIAGVDRSQVPQRTLHPSPIVALALLTTKSPQQTHNDATPSLITRQRWDVRPLHHVEFESCWCHWTTRGVRSWAAGKGEFTPANVTAALNAAAGRDRYERLHVRALRRFLDVMASHKLLVDVGRGRFCALEGAAP